MALAARPGELSDKVVADILAAITEFEAVLSAQLPGLSTDTVLATKLLRKELSGADEKRVKAALSTLRRFRRWCADAGRHYNPWPKPSEEALGAFMVSVAEGGPTAAAGVWHHLEWWRARFGLPFPTGNLADLRGRQVDPRRD